MRKDDSIGVNSKTMIFVIVNDYEKRKKPAVSKR